MWILPSHTSVYAPDTGVLTSASVESLANVCGQSLTVKSKPSRSSYFLRAWKAGNLMRLLSGLIFAPSLGSVFAESRSSRADFPVNPSPQPESAPPITTPVTCSRSSSTASDEHDLPLFSWRTSKASSRPSSRGTDGATPPALRFCSMSSEIWSAWVTEQRRDYSRRQSMREHLTKGSASLSWPTASARDSKGGYQGGRIRNGKLSMDTLDVAVQAYREGGILGQPVRGKSSTGGSLTVSSWTTPTVVDASAMSPNLRPSRIATGRKTDYLARQVQWATPQSRDFKSPKGNKPRWDNPERSRNLNDQVYTTTAKAVLSPRWVETLMGLPIGWCMPSCAHPWTIEALNSAFSVTESSPSAPPSPSPNSLAA